jgi:hypothetical protein
MPNRLEQVVQARFGRERVHGGLRGPRDREPCVGEGLSHADSTNSETENPEERRNVPVRLEEPTCKDDVHACDDEHRVTLLLEVVEQHCRSGRERSAADEKRRRRAPERTSEAELEGEPGDEIQKPERGRDRDDCGMRTRCARNLGQRLRHAHERRDLEQRPPALARRDNERGGEHDRNERGADLLQAALEHERRRHDHRADEAEAGNDFRLPSEGERKSDRGSGTCDRKRSRLRDELVQRDGGEQGCVAARDSGSHSRER